MKKTIIFIIFIIFASSVYGQSSEWTFIAKSSKSNGVTYFYQTDSLKMNSLNGVSAWLKQIPRNSITFSRSLRLKQNIIEILQFATADCNERRLSIENTTLYDTKGEVINFPTIFANSYHEPVIPNSVGEMLLEKLCNDYHEKQLEEIRNQPVFVAKILDQAIIIGKLVTPPEARERKLKGTVRVEIIVDENGSVILAKALNGENILREAAEKAARESKFKPLIRDDRKVKFTGYISYLFFPY